MISARQEEGTTELHRLLKTTKNFDEFKEKFDCLDKKAVAIMAKTIDDSGKIPLQILKKMPLLNKEEYASLLLPYTIEPIEALPEFSKPIRFSTIRKKYPSTPGSVLEKNLKYACYAANRARVAISQSSTHPSLNGKEFKKIFKLFEKIQAQKIGSSNSLIEASVKHALNSNLLGKNIKRYEVTTCEDSIDTSILKIPSHLMLSAMNEKVNIYKQSKIADCDGLAEIAFCIKNYGYPIRQEIFTIPRPGSHVFVVFGRNIESIPEDYKTWGDSAVVCDPWMGKVYPASTGEFRTHYNIGEVDFLKNKNYNILTFFNPKVHSLQAENFCLSINNIRVKVFLEAPVDLEMKKFSKNINFTKDKLITIANLIKASNMDLWEQFSVNLENVLKATTWDFNQGIFILRYWKKIIEFIRLSLTISQDVKDFIDDLTDLTCQALDGFDIETDLGKISNKSLFILNEVSYDLLLALEDTVAFQLPENALTLVFDYVTVKTQDQAYSSSFISDEILHRKREMKEIKEADPTESLFNRLRDLYEKEIGSPIFERIACDIPMLKQNVLIDINRQFDTLEESTDPNRSIQILKFMLNQADTLIQKKSLSFFSEPCLISTTLNKIVRIFCHNHLKLLSQEVRESFYRTTLSCL